MRVGRLGIAFLVVASCHAPARRPSAVAVSSAADKRALLPLDEAHAAELRQLFDEAKDRPRYIVALSPT